jgi:hypothetical protein
MVGYLTANEDGNIINEIGAETPHRIGQMLYAWTNTRHKYPKLLLLPWQRDWIEEVGKFAEECVLKEAYNFHVLDWPAVTDALLKVKASYSPLPDGEAVVQINGNVKLRLCVRNGMPTCAATDQTPDLILSESESVRFLLGPLALQCVSKVPPAKAPLLSAWLPLPLSWHPQDGI